MVALKLVDGNAAVDYRRISDDFDRAQNNERKLKLVNVARKVRAEKARRQDNLWINFAITAILLYFAYSFCTSVWHQIQTSSAIISPSIPIANVTVQPGDTLWKYAVRYGAPDHYILDRVETIARANNISVDAPLAPGENLHIPITNPTLVAQMESHNQMHMAALPH